MYSDDWTKTQISGLEIKHHTIQILKIIGAVLALFGMVTLSVSLWWNREQTIDFSLLLPERLAVCGMQINPEDSQYLALKNWLHENPKGWKRTLATVVPGYLYQSNNIQVSVHSSSVIINYRNGDSWKQVFRTGNTEQIYGDCSE